MPLIYDMKFEIYKFSFKEKSSPHSTTCYTTSASFAQTSTVINTQDIQQLRCDVQTYYSLLSALSYAYMKHSVFMGLKVRAALVFQGGSVER